MKLTILFPVLTALLISAFYLFLPELGRCALPGEPKEKPENKKKAGRKKDGQKKMEAAPVRKDARGEYVALLLVTLLYALVAFSQLGDTKAPQSSHVFSAGESMTLELDGSYELSRAMARSVIGRSSSGQVFGSLYI